MQRVSVAAIFMVTSEQKQVVSCAESEVVSVDASNLAIFCLNLFCF